MSAPRDPDLIIADWLDDGPTRLPESTRRAIMVGLPMTTQRRHALRVPRRFSDMTTFYKFAAGAAAVLAIAVVGAQLVGLRGSQGGVGVAPTATATPGVSPTPSVSPSPTPSPTPPTPTIGALPSPLDTSAWKTFTSDRYGFTIAYPPDWNQDASTKDWDAADRGHWPNPGWDHFQSADTQIGLGAFSVPVGPGTTIDSWLAATCPGYTEPCTGIRDRAVDVTMDGHPAPARPLRR